MKQKFNIKSIDKWLFKWYNISVINERELDTSSMVVKMMKLRNGICGTIKEVADRLEEMGKEQGLNSNLKRIKKELRELSSLDSQKFVVLNYVASMGTYDLITDDDRVYDIVFKEQ